MPALRSQRLLAWLIAGLTTIAAALWAFNRHEAKSAVLYFEEKPDEILTTLRLLTVLPPPIASNRH